MRIIYSGRKTSRTTRLIERCIELNSQGELSYMVCHNHEQCYRVSKKAEELGYNIPFPLTFDEFVRHQYHGKHIKNILIDNADYLLEALSDVKIDTIVMEKREEAEL